MKGFNSHILVLVISVSFFMQLLGSASGQISTPCTTSLVSTFTPCMNYVTGSSYNGTTSPTVDCCNSLKSIITASIDCACLILTANVPLPTTAAVNRLLVVSLPTLCNSPGVPIQCKATRALLPPPGPILFAPPPPPSSAITTRGAAAPQVAPEITSLPPAASPVDVEAPLKTSSVKIRAVMSPSDSSPSCSIWYTTPMVLSLWMMALNLY